MAKARKVIRTKRIYKKHNNKIPSTVMFIILLVLLIGLGYIICREWSKRFGSNALPLSSDQQSSEIIRSSKEESSEITSALSSETSITVQTIKAKMMRPKDMQTSDGAASLKEWFQSAKKAGYNAVYLELKSENGTINFNTVNKMAKEYGTVSKTPVDLNILVKEAKNAGLAPIARISALKDPKAAHVRNENSFAYNNQSGINWLDDSVQRGGKPWLNPYMNNARKYIADICKEISDSGIKTIVLENVNFPIKNTSKMGTIKNTPSRSEILKQFVSEVQESVGDAVVLNGFDAVTLADKAGGDYQVLLSEMEGERFAPIISLEKIMNNKKEIAKKAGVSYDSELSSEMIAEKILSDILEKDKALIPIINEKDVTKMQIIFSKFAIEEYIVV